MKVVNENEFQDEIKDGLVLVDFFATWCGPCRMMSGILEENQDKIRAKILKVDVDDCEKLARSFGIMSIPTIMLFKNGKEVEKHIGLMDKNKIDEMINKHLD